MEPSSGLSHEGARRGETQRARIRYKITVDSGRASKKGGLSICLGGTLGKAAGSHIRGLETGLNCSLLKYIEQAGIYVWRDSRKVRRFLYSQRAAAPHEIRLDLVREAETCGGSLPIEAPNVKVRRVHCAKLITSRCAVASAFCAVNYEIVDLKRLGMEQDCVALCAQVIDGMRAGDQNRWGANDRAAHRRQNRF